VLKKGEQMHGKTFVSQSWSGLRPFRLEKHQLVEWGKGADLLVSVKWHVEWCGESV